ncbi:hypothetical protein BC829DRAFT_379798 [Chytridium lagenaria]|nr:hypothetical protein BC829DRAFT_379798 [Chytridium lagenaria]
MDLTSTLGTPPMQQYPPSSSENPSVKHALESLDRANRLTSEVASVVSSLVNHIDRGSSKSKKRGRPDIAAQEDYGPPTSRLHALIQSLRCTPLLDRILKLPEQDDVHQLSQQSRVLLTSMRSLSHLNPSSIRPTALHARLSDLLVHASLPNSTPTSSDHLSLLLQHILRSQSYQFEERWETSCPQCKTDVVSNYTTLSILELPVLASASSPLSMHSVTLQELVDRRMSGLTLPFRCPFDKCPLRLNNQETIAQSRPQSREMPPLLFVLLRRDTGFLSTASPQPIRVTCQTPTFAISRNSEFFRPHQFRIVAGMVRDASTGEYVMVRQHHIGGLAELAGTSGERWIRCRNEKVDEVEALSRYEEEGLEVLVCENLAADGHNLAVFF